MRTKSGELKYPVRFIRLDTVDGDYGKKKVESTHLSTRCALKQISTAGAFKDGQEVTKNKMLIKCRGLLNVTESMLAEVSLGPQVVKLNITGILPLPDIRETHVYGETVT